jgi:hypothetical protein
MQNLTRSAAWVGGWALGEGPTAWSVHARPPARRCARADCTAYLSMYNSGRVCWHHGEGGPRRPESTEALMSERVSVAG